MLKISKTQDCGDAQGVLPSCAPLANPYVPFQQEGAKRYSRAEALSQGTLFPGLDLPFMAMPQGSAVSSGPLAELQALEFVITELGLYLDTHGDDQEAFHLYQKYVALMREGRARYIELYGPLFQSDSADFDAYRWLQSPWPWEYQEGEHK